jgi:type VI protein secretion system component VasF
MPGIVKNFPAWFVAAACGLVIILLFILLSTLLGSSAEHVINSLK